MCFRRQRWIKFREILIKVSSGKNRNCGPAKGRRRPTPRSMRTPAFWCATRSAACRRSWSRRQGEVCMRRVIDTADAVRRGDERAVDVLEAAADATAFEEARRHHATEIGHRLGVVAQRTERADLGHATSMGTGTRSGGPLPRDARRDGPECTAPQPAIPRTAGGTQLSGRARRLCARPPEGRVQRGVSWPTPGALATGSGVSPCPSRPSSWHSSPFPGPPAPPLPRRPR